MLLAAVIIFVVIRFSTFGWQFSGELKVIFSIPEQETAHRLQHAVEVLSEEIGIRSYAEYENLEKAAEYIENFFKGLGYETQIHAYEIEGQTFKNIVAYQKEAKAQDWIILGAHYDSCFNPGADDNASGVAGLLELARLLKDSPSVHSLRFVAFTNEEPPFFSY